MRLIDADELINDITECKNGFIGTHFEVVVHDEKCDYAIDMIESAETVDNMKHGHWYAGSIGGLYYFHVCSECKIPSEESNYCPNCGAKMDEVSE